MRKEKSIILILTILVCIILSANIFANDGRDTVFIKSKIEDTHKYKIDTVIFDSPFFNHILYGTTILPDTWNQINAKGLGILLTDVEQDRISDGCMPDSDQILFIEKSDSTLTIKANISGNSCHSFLCDVKIVNDNTLNLITHEYGTYCACLSSYLLTFKFNLMEFANLDKIKNVSINGEGIIPLEPINKITEHYINNYLLTEYPQAIIGNNPLYLVDGIELKSSGFAEKDIKNIESIKFLNPEERQKSHLDTNWSSIILIITKQ